MIDLKNYLIPLGRERPVHVLKLIMHTFAVRNRSLPGDEVRSNKRLFFRILLERREQLLSNKDQVDSLLSLKGLPSSIHTCRILKKFGNNLIKKTSEMPVPEALNSLADFTIFWSLAITDDRLNEIESTALLPGESRTPENISRGVIRTLEMYFNLFA